MPRTNTNTKQTEFYRLLVESFYDGEWHETMYYGPYFNAGAAKAAISGAEHYYKDRYEKGTRRSRPQKQAINWDAPGYYERPNDLNPKIVWIDVA